MTTQLDWNATAVEAIGLAKTYPDGVEAVRGIDFAVATGEVFGLLGPNGAGKSTTIGMLTTTIAPTAGTALLAGHDVVADPIAARAVSSVVFQEAVVDRALTGRRNLELHARLWGVAPTVARSRIADVTDAFGLLDVLARPIDSYSGGQRRRLEIARALVSEPQVLFLDEPTAGVDVELRKDMWEIVRTLRASGVTIILTTHYIEEAEEMADRVGVINKGELVLVEDKATLMSKLGKKQLTLQLHSKLDAVPDALARHGLTLAADGAELVYTYDTKGERTGITALLGDLNAAQIRFKDLHTTQSSLEDIFVDLVRQRQ
jgi:ABC-2 type transport system ATP-binding protein